MTEKLNREQFIQNAVSVHGDKYDYANVVYVNNKVSVEIICPEHGSFWQKPNNHVNRKQGCPLCAKTHKLTQQDWIEKARAVHGNKYDYSKVTYKNAEEKVEIICNKCGTVFWQLAGNHLKGKGCPTCRYDSIRASNPMHCEQNVEHLRQSVLQQYGTDNIAKSDYYKAIYPEIKKKREESLRRNGTFSSSEPEDVMYGYLCDIFSVSDVKRNHSTVDYPFVCDFYIISRSLYIELNASWTHGGHWFDLGNDSDILDIWTKKADSSEYYRNAISVWTKRDVNKRQVACNNNLNYAVFWKNDLSDFYEWCEAGCPDAKDWDKMYSWKDNAI